MGGGGMNGPSDTGIFPGPTTLLPPPKSIHGGASGGVAARREVARDGLVVICGPSGGGKSTMIKRLMAEIPGRFGFSVSHTTRAPRPGEKDGVDYHFVAREEITEEIAQGNFLESAEVHGNYYGTS